MKNVINSSVSVIAIAISLACGGAMAQEDQINTDTPPDYLTLPENVPPPPDQNPLQPDLEREPARPEQVEDSIEEVLYSSSDPSTPTDDGSALDTDRTGRDTPTDDRTAAERIDSTLDEDGSPPAVTETPADPDDTSEDPGNAESEEEAGTRGIAGRYFADHNCA